MRPDWPSNENTVEIEKADRNTFTWRHTDPDPENRPVIESYGSKFMEGFAEAVVTLARKEAVGPDLGKYDTLRIYDAYGKVVYEGRVVSFELDTDTQRVTVTATGWMTHARDRPMLPVLYVDKDRSKWTESDQARRDYLGGFSQPVVSPESGDDSESGAVRLTVRDEWAAPYRPTCLAFYLAPAGTAVARVYGRLYQSLAASPSEWDFIMVSRTPDAPETTDSTADLYTSEDQLIEYEPEEPQRIVEMKFGPDSGNTPGGAAGSENTASVSNLAVYGDHGLTRYGAEPAGLLASDIIIHSAGRFAPLLDTSGVEPSPHIVDQCREDDQQDPLDFWLKLNKYEHRHLAVWEERRLEFTDLDYDDVNWRVREADDGVTVKWTGESTIADHNGIIVQFQSVETGRREIVTPDDDDRLADTSPTIAANEHGIEAWVSITLPNPDSREGAIRYGQLVLREANRRKQSGTITVFGAIRDGARHWHPLGHPRASQTVLVEDIGGGPRLITEAKVTQPEVLTMTVDGKAETTDAILDELLTDASLRRNT